MMHRLYEKNNMIIFLTLLFTLLLLGTLYDTIITNILKNKNLCEDFKYKENIVYKNFTKYKIKNIPILEIAVGIISSSINELDEIKSTWINEFKHVKIFYDGNEYINDEIYIKLLNIKSNPKLSINIIKYLYEEYPLSPWYLIVTNNVWINSIGLLNYINYKNPFEKYYFGKKNGSQCNLDGYLLSQSLVKDIYNDINSDFIKKNCFEVEEFSELTELQELLKIVQNSNNIEQLLLISEKMKNFIVIFNAKNTMKLLHYIYHFII